MSRIPAAPFEPLIRCYLTSQPDENTAISALSERACVHYDTIHALLNLDQESVSFDIADKLLVAMGMVQLWRCDPELREVYLKTPLDEVCECCGAHFRPPRLVETGGGFRGRPLYCSPECRRAQHKINVGRKSQRMSKHRREKFKRGAVCRNGHARTEENTQILKSGERRCRVCARESTQKCRERQRELRAAA